MNTTTSLQSLFETYPNASLRKLAAATGVNYGVLLKKSKDPIPGEAYDPEATNWKALEDKLTSKGIDWNTLDWVAMNQGPNRQGSTLHNAVMHIDSEEHEENTIAQVFQKGFKVGDKVYLRRNNTTPYEILYKTETHIVIMLEGTTEPQAWANNTFLINGPVYQPRAEKSKKEEVEEA